MPDDLKTTVRLYVAAFAIVPEERIYRAGVLLDESEAEGTELTVHQQNALYSLQQAALELNRAHAALAKAMEDGPAKTNTPESE